ncbi:nucleoside-diphosphate-sugar epimerase [Neofusicoccum parvum]|nr:nucleoside-diphosphate-sugar epimerase [Neofusicoccum parvum]
MSYPLPPATENLASTLNVITTNSSDASDASFLVFDPRGRKILGADPSLEHMFSTTPGVIQEAPVYVPELNAIIFSTFTPDVYPQSIIYLNETEPRLETFYADPPVWGVNGGRYRDGKIYWAVAGSGDFRASNQTVGQTTGIYTLDPLTMKSTVLVNNYFGVPFNSPDDLVIDDRGDIFFTDPWYGWAMGYAPAPVLHPSTWRFRPSTGVVTVVENTVEQPNGIGISPDGATLYLTDSGNDIVNGSITGIVYNSTNTHCVWAFNVNPSPAGGWLSNRRPLWCTEAVGHDGFHVAANGYLVGAAGYGVDILSEWGELLLHIQTNYTVNNVQFAGPKLDELWLFGMGGISRVRWDLAGLPQARS